MVKKPAITALISALLSGVAYAGQFDARSFDLDASSAKIEILEGEAGTSARDAGQPPAGPMIDPPMPSLPQAPGGFNPDGVNQAIGVIDNVVNLADKIWGIIEKNKPVVTIASNYASAVPFGTSHWTQLQGWSKPLTKKYRFSMNGVNVVYQVHWTYGGNFQGKGKFLTGVSVEPLSVTAPWGHKVDLTAEVPDSTVANVGTKEDPIASMQIQLKWKISTGISSVDQKAIYYIQGDGFMQELGTPFKKGLEDGGAAKIERLGRELDAVKF